MDSVTGSCSLDESDANPAEFVIINYPGVVKNGAKALEHFGGLQTINTKHFAGRPLEFHYHPSNAYSRSMFVERCPIEKANRGAGAVLFIASVRRKKTDPNVVKAKVIGMVSTIYSIQAIADFQYLPLRKNDSKDTFFEDMVPKLIPTSLTSAFSWWNQPEVKPRVSLFQPPYQFSRHTGLASKMLCKEPESVTEASKQQSGGHGRSRRIERRALTITVHGTDEFPAEPSEAAVIDADLRCKSEDAHQVMRDLFTERPMWSRAGINHQTGLDDNIIKILLQKYGFYVSSGPWGRLWCRFGYDPKIDPAAKKYQTVMVTFRQHAKIPERQRLKITKAISDRVGRVSVSGSASLIPPIQDGIIDTDINYIYTPGELPCVRQMWYCICDVKLPIAEEILRKEFFAHGERADEQNGWLPPKAIYKIRQAIKEDVGKVTTEIDDAEETNDEDWWSTRDHALNE